MQQEQQEETNCDEIKETNKRCHFLTKHIYYNMYAVPILVITRNLHTKQTK